MVVDNWWCVEGGEWSVVDDASYGPGYVEYSSFEQSVRQSVIRECKRRGWEIRLGLPSFYYSDLRAHLSVRGSAGLPSSV